MAEFLTREDCFEIKCKNCGSTDVDTYTDECGICGTFLKLECNKCHAVVSGCASDKEYKGDPQ